MSEQPSQVVNAAEGDDFWIDGSDPTGQSHLCAKGNFGEELAAGPVEECCIDLWRDGGVEV